MSYFGGAAAEPSAGQDMARNGSTASAPGDYFGMATPSASSASSQSPLTALSGNVGLASNGQLPAGSSNGDRSMGQPSRSAQSAADPFTAQCQASAASVKAPGKASNSPFKLVPPTPRAGPSQPPNEGGAHPWAKLFGNKPAPLGGLRMAQTPAARDEGPRPASSPGRSPNNRMSLPPSNRRNEPQQQSHKQTMKMRIGGSAMTASNSTPQMGGVDLTRFQPIRPTELATLLSQSENNTENEGAPLDGATLVIDIRPSTSFATARIRKSVNVCAPSTLLKRVGVTIDRIEDEMLSSRKDAARFSAWRRGPRRHEMGSEKVRSSSASASSSIKMQSTSQSSKQLNSTATQGVQRIVVLDTDTQSVTDAGRPCSGGGGPCLTGMLRKFDVAGFAGDLHWLVGGFNAFASSVDDLLHKGQVDGPYKSLVDREDVDGDAASKEHEMGYDGDESAEPSSISSAPRKSLVQPRGLPMEAFLSSSTTNNKPSGDDASPAASSKKGQTPSVTAANPFYDTIRQNRELQHGVLEKIPLDLPTISSDEQARFPSFLRDIVGLQRDERTASLAKAFFDVEIAERDRLMATMQQHSTVDGSASDRQDRANAVLQLSSPYSSITSPAIHPDTEQSKGASPGQSAAPSFPFSISAAIERGSENRYNNIWTYEHSRVQCTNVNDFFNGSHIEPGRKYGCARRYIATQAPLPATFETFWGVVWAQNVRTICMVTRVFESGRVQGHNYWNSQQYGRYRVESMEETWLDALGDPIVDQDKAAPDPQNSYFGGSNTQGKSAQPQANPEGTSVRRRLRLKNEEGQRRTITQFHFMAWPDYSVPETAAPVLSFMRQANRAQLQADWEIRANEGQSVGPLVVHCSAGVGRTGTYIVIDAVLDILRRARTSEQSPLATWDDGFVHDSETMRGRSMSTDSSSSLLDSGLSIAHRRHLKRELSPSAMEVGGETTNGAMNIASPTREAAMRSIDVRDTDSPPPARRSRSDEEPEDDSAPGSSSQGSSSDERRGSSGQTSTSFSSFSRDGSQTPSTALGKMSLSASQHTGSPVKSRIAMQLSDKLDKYSDGKRADATGITSPTSPLSRETKIHDSPIIDNSTPRAERPPKLLFPPAEPQHSDTRSRSNTTQSSHDGNAHVAVEAVQSGADLVRAIVETMREQRMSMVQTTRQYVFAYRAVLEGVLFELRHAVDGQT